MENRESGGYDPQSDAEKTAQRETFRRRTDHLLEKFGTRRNLNPPGKMVPDAVRRNPKAKSKQAK